MNADIKTLFAGLVSPVFCAMILKDLIEVVK